MHGYGLMTSPEAVAAFDLSRFRRFVDVAAPPVIWPWPPVSATPTCKESSSILRRSCRWHGSLWAPRKWLDASSSWPATSLLIPCLGGHLRPGRILHDWPEAKIHQLLTRIYQCVPPGGGVLIMEKLIDEDRRGPVWALMQSLNMLTLMDGKERTFSEYEMLCNRARFARVCGSRHATPLDAVLALKAG